MIATSLAPLMAMAMVIQSSDAASRQTMTREIVRACVAEVGTAGGDPVPSCACTAGWLSAQLNYRDFYVVGRMYHFATDAQGMQREIGRLVDEAGYAPSEILRISRFLQDSEGEMRAACGFLED
tara:strand:+ start:18415 stop:18786 length:372 start_codon:yes stop_codon:yes gene_type:complete